MLCVAVLGRGVTTIIIIHSTSAFYSTVSITINMTWLKALYTKKVYTYLVIYMVQDIVIILTPPVHVHTSTQ